MFSNKAITGIEIGATTINTVGFKFNKNKFIAQFHEAVDLVGKYGLNSYYDVDEKVIIQALSYLNEKYQLNKTHLRLAIPSDKSIFKIIDVKREQVEPDLTESIRQQFAPPEKEQNEEVEISCFELENAKNDSDTVSLLACAVPIASVNYYKSLLQNADLHISIMDLDVFALYNAFYYMHYESIKHPVTIVEVGSQYSISVMTMPGEHPFFKIINLGSDDITKNMMQETGLNFSKAEKLKRRVLQTHWLGSESYKKSKISEIYSEFVEKFLIEIKKCIRHYQATKGSKDAGEIFLTGSGAQLPSLNQRIKEKLKIKSTVWNPMAAFWNKRESAESLQAVQLTVALGTVLRGD